MDAVTLAYAKAYLSELVRRAGAGKEIIITRSGQPVARLIQVAAPTKPLRSLADFRATLPKRRKPSAQLIRALRDEGQ